MVKPKLDKYSIEHIIEVLKKSLTITQASKTLNVSLSTLKRYCKKHNIMDYYKPNINMYKLDDKTFIEICKKSKSMMESARKMNIPFTSFIRRAKKLKCYKPDPSQKGYSKKEKVKLKDILNGNAYIAPGKLKIKLISKGYKKYVCEKCGCNGIWMGEEITLELHHIDGDRYNNKLENLEILCPNCHSQTKTYRSRNKNKK